MHVLMGIIVFANPIASLCSGFIFLYYELLQNILRYFIFNPAKHGLARNTGTNKP